MEKPIKQSTPSTKPRQNKIRIKIIGVGGAGGNAVESIAKALKASAIRAGGTGGEPSEDKNLAIEPSRLTVCFAAVNTDAQALDACEVAEKLQIGIQVTHGLGAGGDPVVGRQAAESSTEEIRGLLRGAELVIVTAGMGGGTGTGASPLVARLAREQGAVVLGLVTLPFEFEGERRRKQALGGMESLREDADGVIAVPNDKLFKMVDGRAGVTEAFRQANSVLVQVVQAVEKLLSGAGIINVDFADLRSVLRKSGQMVFGFGEGRGEKKTAQAIAALLANPLLDGGKSLESAEEILVSIVGGKSLTFHEIQETMTQLSRHLSDRAHIKMGAAVHEENSDKLSVTLLAGLGQGTNGRQRSVVQSNGRSVFAPTLRDGKPGPTAPGKTATPVRSNDKGGLNAIPMATTTSLHGTNLYESSEESGIIRINAGETGTIGTPQPIEKTGAKNGISGAPGLVSPKSSPAPESSASPSAGQAKLKQPSLPLEIGVKGCFGKLEPTIYQGEDLDTPTFLRKGMRI